MLRGIPDVGKLFLLIKGKDKEATMKRLKSEVCFVYHFLFNQIKLSVPKLLIYFQ
jgi:hypothetical protein